VDFLIGEIRDERLCHRVLRVASGGMDGHAARLVDDDKLPVRVLVDDLNRVDRDRGLVTVYGVPENVQKEKESSSSSGEFFESRGAEGWVRTGERRQSGRWLSALRPGRSES
jgi:hypothetical protein